MINFTRNVRPTIGVEVELHLVDARTGNLISAANELLEELGSGHPDGEHPKVKHELFQSTVEIITGICDNPAEARLDLQETLDELVEACRPRGIKVISSGTHPFGIARDMISSYKACPGRRSSSGISCALRHLTQINSSAGVLIFSLHP